MAESGKQDGAAAKREVLSYDVVVVGGGPAGLAAALRLKQLAASGGFSVSVCVLEKGAEVGGHILSGAVFDPCALNVLIPDWKKRGAPLESPVLCDRFYYLTKRRALRLPTPPQMRNHGNYMISLGALCRWLARQAEEAGVEIYAGFAASEILYHGDGSVRGVATGAMGIRRNGNAGASYQPGVEIEARQTLIAEGARGSLAKVLLKRFRLTQGVAPQTYGLGLKELWEVAPDRHEPGLALHSVGWPLDHRTYGGSFLYHLKGGKVSCGFVVGLDYENPWLSPYDEFQRFKTHPFIRRTLEGGRRIAYGARALTEGGYQCIPRLTFPGGALIGCAAGFLDVPRLKGSHNAMASGMIAAREIADALRKGRLGEGRGVEVTSIGDAMGKSAMWRQLRRSRNIRPAFRHGLAAGMAYAVLDTYVLRGRAPWTLRHGAPDHASLKKADAFRPSKPPSWDGKLTFDKMSSVYLSSVAHREDQPCHLRLRDRAVPIRHNLALYSAPEQRYCPAGVYEILQGEDGAARLQINAQNCIHCKSCDIKDPLQNIDWVPPEGGGGPNYPDM